MAMDVGYRQTDNSHDQQCLLLDYLMRLASRGAGRRALHLRLSALKPCNRRDHHVRTARSGFEALIRDLQGQLFVLPSTDFLFVYRADAHSRVDAEARKLRFLFGDDPLFDGEDGESRFAIWLDAEKDFEEIVRLGGDITQIDGPPASEPAGSPGSPGSIDDTRSRLKRKQMRGEALTPELLARIETSLDRADLSNLVRRQAVCSINRGVVQSHVFSELYVSIPDLGETVLPRIDLTANRWLFQHLTETLDRRVLAMLVRSDVAPEEGMTSINLNVSTLLSDAFLAFDESIPAARRGAFVIELQHADVLDDLSAYFLSRNFLRDKGYRICLDGLTHDSLGVIHDDRLGADIVKLFWHPHMVDDGERIRRQIGCAVGQTRSSEVVLSRVDTEQAVLFGHSVGIQLFQGRHVEHLVSEDYRRRQLLRLKHGARHGT